MNRNDIIRSSNIPPRLKLWCMRHGVETIGALLDMTDEDFKKAGQFGKLKRGDVEEIRKEVEKERFAIIVNEHQYNTLMWAAEAMSRIICGQLNFTLRDICESAWERDHKSPEYPYGVCAPGWDEMRDQLEDKLEEVRKLCWNQNRGTLYGINYNETADELWDIYQVMRKWDFDNMKNDTQRENLRMTVLGDDPLHVSDQPLIKIERK